MISKERMKDFLNDKGWICISGDSWISKSETNYYNVLPLKQAFKKSVNTLEWNEILKTFTEEEKEEDCTIYNIYIYNEESVLRPKPKFDSFDNLKVKI